MRRPYIVFLYIGVSLPEDKSNSKSGTTIAAIRHSNGGLYIYQSLINNEYAHTQTHIHTHAHTASVRVLRDICKYIASSSGLCTLSQISDVIRTTFNEVNR
jgi:hypothetical protein